MTASNTVALGLIHNTIEATIEATIDNAIDNTTAATVQSALRDCFDPSLPCNIVDLGLIQSVSLTHDPDAPGAAIPGVSPKYSVAITLLPTTHDDNVNALLVAQVQNRLAGLEQVLHTTVTLLDFPAWTPHRITPAGRRTLGLDGNPSLIQISGARSSTR
jgi:metal-sulfur cluster biosynthetic enzyme